MSATNKQSSQEYELKLGVIHHASLKTTQLIQFLQNQANEFLDRDLPQYIKGDQKFVNLMESFSVQNQQLAEYSFEEYVGLLLIYSTSSEESFEHFMRNVQSILQLEIGDLFIVVIEMDNSDKQANVIGNTGEKYCTRNALQFVRLTLYNSEDLISVINRNLYELIQNYYYPNQQVQENKPTTLSLTQPDNLSRKQNHNRSSSREKDSQYVFAYDQKNSRINAFSKSASPNKQQMEEMLNHAANLRKSRKKQILIEQEHIDESIQNVQNVLNNINHRIKQKLESGWFTSMKDNLYMTAEKGNQNFSKIKLTQEFIADDLKKQKRPSSSVVQSRYSDMLNQTSKSFVLNFNTLKFNSAALKNPILKLVMYFSKENVIQLQVYDNSTYEELASITLRRLGLKQTNKNTDIMMQKIRRRVQGFSKQFNRAIKVYEQKKIHQRSFLKSKVNQQQ